MYRGQVSRENGGGLVISMIAFYSNDSSLNPAGV